MQKSQFLFILVLVFLSACSLKPEYENIASETENRLHCIYFVNDSVGIIAGGERYSKDKLLRTTNGGATWDTIGLGIHKILTDISFVNDSVGLICGLDGHIIKTKDAGKTWEQVPMRWNVPLNLLLLHGIQVVNDSVVVAVGGDGYTQGIIVRSTDLGETWTMVDTFGVELRKVAFVDKLKGYACGYGAILKTSDAGLHWEFTNEKDEFFSAITFPSKSVGYVVGRTGTILKTQDGGTTWKRLRNGNNPLQTRFFFNDVKFLTEDLGYIVGDNGVVWKTTDGGKNWKSFQKESDKTNYFEVFLFKEGQGWLVGDKGKILKFSE